LSALAVEKAKEPADGNTLQPDNIEGARQALLQLRLIQREMAHRESRLNPTTYGLPDLLFDQGPDETDAAFRIRRTEAMRCVCEDHLWFSKEHKRYKIELIAPQLKLLTEMFYGYVTKGILWKARGCGGSLTAAILIWLCMVYKHRSCVDMAGSGEQAKQVYNYATGFWDCKPGLKQQFLVGAPLISQTTTRAGAILQCIASSQTAVRGKHTSMFVGDESCQEGDTSGDTFKAALQGPMSEEDHLILLLSTFHWPFGFFQEFWDGAGKMGFTQYKWDVYDAMQRCTLAIDCERECPLTRKADVLDLAGRKIGERLVGCHGKGRNVDGFKSRRQVLEIQKMNLGTDIFEVEYECNRPGTKKHVIPYEAIDASIMTMVPKPDWIPRHIWTPGTEPIPDELLLPPMKASAGVDWGLVGQTALMFGVRYPDWVMVVRASFMTGQLTPAVISALFDWRRQFMVGFPVFCDASHPYNNVELAQAGFDVQVVPFNRFKKFGYQNLQRAFAHGKIKLYSPDCDPLVDQLKRLRTNKMGNIEKKDDHGPDALMCQMLHFLILDEFPDTRIVEEKFQEDGSLAIPEDSGTKSSVILI
jgi:hypothetical protein